MTSLTPLQILQNQLIIAQSALTTAQANNTSLNAIFANEQDTLKNNIAAIQSQISKLNPA